MAMAPIASRFFAASSLFASTVGVVGTINTCAAQRECIQWEMTPSINECPASPVTVINANKLQCPGRWKVCMTVTRNIDGNAAGCPAAFISGRCPSETCETGSDRLPQQMFDECKKPWPIVGGNANDLKYCQYGVPGEELLFKVMDGVGAAGECTGPNVPRTATMLTVNGKSCTAAVACNADDDGSKNCGNGCALRARPCVHRFTVPNDECACTATTTTSSSTTSTSSSTASASSTTQQKPAPPPMPPTVSPGALESMPNKPQGLVFGGLAESKGSGLASPAVLVAGVALAVATVAAAVVAMARRGAAGAGAVQATGEVEEAFLPEQFQG